MIADGAPPSPADRLPRPMEPSLTRSRLRRRLTRIACAALLPIGLTACGGGHPTSVDSESQYVWAGPVTYQVQLSRELNPFTPEDREYLSSVPAAQQTLRPDQEWFAIFLWAKNSTGRPQTTASTFDIVDTQGNKYYPTALDARVNPFAWTPETLNPRGTEPGPDSPAFFGPTQGQEILFKLTDSVYDNRPLTLEIYPPGQSKPSSVSLDL